MKFRTILTITAFTAGTIFAGSHEHEHAEQTPNIVEIAAGNEDFSTLVAAVQAAGLVEALSAEGPFTVFAPTNAAFAALPEGTVEALLQPEGRDLLISVLTYHVVAGKVTAEDVVGIESAETLQGAEIQISVEEETVRINEAQVIQTDIMGSNGVIHVIDAVIMPPTE